MNIWEYQNALDLYKEIIEENTNHKLAYYNMWLVLEKLNKQVEAVNAYNECIRIDKNFINAYINKLPILKDLGMQEKVLETYEEIIRFCKEVANNKEICKLAYYTKWNFLVELNRYQAALAAYEEAITIDPDFEDVIRAKDRLQDMYLLNVMEWITTWKNDKTTDKIIEYLLKELRMSIKYYSDVVTRTSIEQLLIKYGNIKTPSQQILDVLIADLLKIINDKIDRLSNKK